MASSMPVVLPSDQTVPVSGTFYQATQPVSAVTLPLPSGASTLAEQQTQTTSLSAIDTGIPAALGQALMASSMPVVLPSDQTVPVSGTFYQATQPVSAVTLPLPSGASTLAEQQTQTTSLSAIDTGIPAALGQALMASSMPVVLPSDQTVPVSGTFYQATQPVSAATLPLPSGASTLAEQQTQTTSLSAIDTGIPAALGQALMASSMPVVLPSDQTVAISAASLPLPTGAATSAKQDTGNTSLSSIDGKITAVNTGAVVISSGTITTITNAVPTKAPVNAAGSGSAASATVSTVITLTAPANTAGFVLMNLDTSTANIRWAVGRTATTVLGQQLQAGRDTGFIPSGADISLVAESGTQNYDVQWISQ